MNEKKECEFISQNDVNKALLHCNWANRRMLIALITVCVTFIVTIIVFVTGYTAREQNWLNTIRDMQTPVQEVTTYGQRTD